MVVNSAIIETEYKYIISWHNILSMVSVFFWWLKTIKMCFMFKNQNKLNSYDIWKLYRYQYYFQIKGFFSGWGRNFFSLQFVIHIIPKSWRYINVFYILQTILNIGSELCLGSIESLKSETIVKIML